MKDSSMIYALQDGSIVETSSYKQAVSNADENSVLKKLIDEFGHQLNESSESISEGEDVKDFVSEEVLKNANDKTAFEDVLLESGNDLSQKTNSADISEVKSMISRRVSIASFKPNRVLIEQENDNRKTKQKA